MKFAVAQIGARMHYAVPRILHEAGMLEELYTDICAVKGWPRLLNLIPEQLRNPGMKRLLGRVPHGVPKSFTTAFTTFGQEYARRRARATSEAAAIATHLWAGQEFCQRVIRKGLGEASGVYTFNTAGLELLRYARARGLTSIMEQTIAPKRLEQELLRKQRELFPDWELTPSCEQHVQDFITREESEWETADLIVCGSEFVREGLAACGGPVERCMVVPYGVDVRFQVPHRPKHNGPLRVLTVGAIGLRKGTPYVYAAAQALKGRAQFRMVGSIGVVDTALSKLRQSVEVVGPVPRSQILEQYQWADLFLLPSICEGSATVTYEALACGLPVVTTPNTGTIVRDGIDGRVVPTNDISALIKAIDQFAASSEYLNAASQSARRRASEYGLSNYRDRLLAAIVSAFGKGRVNSSLQLPESLNSCLESLKPEWGTHI